MDFDSNPDAMTENGQIWFPADYDRIRMWTTPGRTAVVRPAMTADASASLGYECDILWAAVCRLDKSTADRTYAEWMVCRPDLGIAVSASKIEVAVNSYYEHLLDASVAPVEGTLRNAMGREAARSMTDQFSSREPRFVLLSRADRAPFIVDSDESLRLMAETADNVLPSKRSAYDPVWKAEHRRRLDS